MMVRIDPFPLPRMAAVLLPPEAQPLLDAFLPHFTQPTYARFLVLAVANVLRTVGELAPGHDACYRRVLSTARWSALELGGALAQVILERLVLEGPIDLVGDDTVDGHSGPRVYGKGRHRDGVRSLHSDTA